MGTLCLPVCLFHDCLTMNKVTHMINKVRSGVCLPTYGSAIFILLPVILFQCHAFLVHGSLHLGLVGEDAFVQVDDALDQGIDLSLQSYGIIVVSPSYQAGTETHSQVIRLHHVLVTVLGHAVDGYKKRLRKSH